MARVKAKPRKPIRKKTASRKKNKKAIVSLKGVVYVLLLAVLLFFSLAVLTYVVFFRMVVASELQQGGEHPVLEAPGQPKNIICRGDGPDQLVLKRFGNIIEYAGNDRQRPVELSGKNHRRNFS